MLTILTSKKNTKRCEKTYNFNISIKLVDKNHIIYNKNATNTQNLFNLMKERKKKRRKNKCKLYIFFLLFFFKEM